MAKKARIILERKRNAYLGRLGSMSVVIDDALSLKLKNGESRIIEVPNGKTEFDIQISNYCTFHIKNVPSVKKIVLQYRLSGTSCLVIYQDGHEFNAPNKNSSVTSTNNTLLIILFVLTMLLLSSYGLWRTDLLQLHTITTYQTVPTSPWGVYRI